MANSFDCLFIGDLISEGLRQGSCITERNLSLSEFKYENNAFQFETDLCSKVNQADLTKENIQVVVGIKFQLETEFGIMHGSLSADVVSAGKYATNLEVESSFLLGKFKISQYQLIPVELLSILCANVSKKVEKISSGQNSPDAQILKSIDAFQKFDSCVEKANELLSSAEDLKVMTSEEKTTLSHIQKASPDQKIFLLVDRFNDLQELNSETWIHKIFSVIIGMQQSEKMMVSRTKYLDTVVDMHRNRLKILTALSESWITYVSEAKDLNDFLAKENCFVLFYNQKSEKSDPERFANTLTFFGIFAEANKDAKSDQVFLAVDTNIISKLEIMIEDVPDEVLIYRISKFEIVSKNFMKDYKDGNESNLARSKKFGDGEVSAERGRFLMRCPKSLCSNEYREWLCEKCGSYLDYGFNGSLYCTCHCFSGNKGTLLENFGFRCKAFNHGLHFVDYNPEYKIDSVPIKNISILILGQKYVGKTTFIKAVASVLAFGDFKSAAKKMEDFNDLEISETKDCQVYNVRFGDHNIRFIDTPGFSGEIQDDAENVKKILNYIANFELLNAVCVFTKSYEWEAKILQMKFCVKQILSFLHQNLSNNIVFCSTYFPYLSLEPENTLPVLTEIVAENKSLSLHNRNRFYFFDIGFYDGIRNQSSGVSINEMEEGNIYLKGWDKTAKEIDLLLLFVTSLEPQDVSATIKLNESRHMIYSLINPLFEAAEKVKKYIRTVEDVERMVQSFSELREKFGDDNPENVRTDECCLQFQHNKLTGNSQKCLCCKKKCSGTGDLVLVSSGNFDIIVKSKKNDKVDKVSTDSETFIGKLYGEKEKIVEAYEKFANYLESHAILAINDSCDDHLDYLIGEKRDTPDTSTAPQKDLLKLKADHKKEMKLLYKCHDSNIEKCDESDLNELKEELYSLPIFGGKIKANSSDNCNKNRPTGSSAENTAINEPKQWFQNLDRRFNDLWQSFMDDINNFSLFQIFPFHCVIILFIFFVLLSFFGAVIAILFFLIFYLENDPRREITRKRSSAP